MLKVLTIDLHCGHLVERVRAGQVRLTSQRGQPEEQPASSVLTGITEPSSVVAVSRTRPATKKVTPRDLTGVLHDLVGAVADHFRVRNERLLIGVAQPQRRRNHRAQCVLHTLLGGEVVVSTVEMKPRPPRGVPGPPQKCRFVASASAGDVSLTVVRYWAPPRATVVGVTPGRRCGSSLATRVSNAHTLSGESPAANLVGIAQSYAPQGRLRFVNEVLASIEFGMIRMPLPVSMCTARQFTSTTRPRAVPVSSQSSIRNGCSNSMNKPDTIWPTEFAASDR